jgi:hypothetical protein
MVLETVRNIYFLSAILELYNEIAVSRKPLHVHIHILLRMIDTMISHNIDLSS